MTHPFPAGVHMIPKDPRCFHALKGPIYVPLLGGANGFPKGLVRENFASTGDTVARNNFFES